jgi:vacuolar-type H+-ATPase subunit I/STV1
MPSPFDPSDFEDHEYKAAQEAPYRGTGEASGSQPTRPPTRDEVDSQVGEMQKRISDLKRQQENLERERTQLEETRRRQAEFENSRTELLEQLTRGVGVLEEKEMDARREVDAMAKALGDLRLALNKIQGLREDTWSTENFQIELTRALTTLENARMEWHSVRVKFPSVDQSPEEAEEAAQHAARAGNPFLQPQDWPQLFRLGVALTWPLVLLGIAIVVVLMFSLRN